MDIRKEFIKERGNSSFTTGDIHGHFLYRLYLYNTIVLAIAYIFLGLCKNTTEHLWFNRVFALQLMMSG